LQRAGGAVQNQPAMTHWITRGLAIALITAGSGIAAATAQAPASAAHVAAAKTAAGAEFAGVFQRICTEAVAVPATAASRAARGAVPRPAGPPPRESWHAEPVKVFDNLYFLGQTEYSVWAITTSAGVILIDSIFDYSVDDEVVGGMRKLGLDPATIKYVILSHGHSDHSGGAKYLQDRFNARVILGAADWDLLEGSTGTRPRRDLVGADGQQVTLGDTTVTLHATPGHTLGTLSVVFAVRDNGVPHMAATWGGTAFNWMNNPAPYVTPERPVRYWFETYSASARRFKEITSKAGVDVLVSNHTIFDGSKTKLPALGRRKPGDPHPYVIGKEAVQRYLTVVDECAQAGLASAK
jgi:metallo-beta-lactamase class B